MHPCTVTGPPVTPQSNRSRSARSGVTPERVARAPRTTYELPQEFDIGLVNKVATTASMSGETGRDLPYGVIPNESTVKFKKMHNVGKSNLGYLVVLAETIIASQGIQKYKVILGILQRRMVIDASPEDDGSS